jgi:hypothetical protein
MSVPVTLRWFLLGSACLLGACGTRDTPGRESAPTNPSMPNDTPTPPPLEATYSRAYGQWQPTRDGECPKALHDQYWVYGPDGKVYPTWHPPTDTDPVTGRTCTYGHEHGDDPQGSRLSRLEVPFGYVNEQLSPNDPQWQRNEDHVGHKVFIANSLAMERDGKVGARCDIAVKLHQGTHSHDAFTNNLHELFYDTKCDDGTELHWKSLQAFGKGGHVLNGCETKVLTLFPENDEQPSGTATPDLKTRQTRGSRQIPDRACADGITNSDFQLWLMSETWITTLERTVQRADGGTTHFAFGPYFEVGNPSRFFDPAAPNRIGRHVDLCYGPKALTGFTCDGVRNLEPSGLQYDDPRSPFKGTERNLRFAGLTLENAGGPSRWYSDVFGENLQATPDTAKGISLEQFIGSVTNSKWAGAGSIPSRHDHPGVHAPN